MEVILLKELRGRGGEGDVINVSRGFANNYLLRQGYAVKATPGNLKQLEQRRKNIEQREVVRVADATALAEKLANATVTIMAQVGEEGQLFGSVTAPMIADAIAEQFDLEIDRRRVELGKPIKVVGEYEILSGSIVTSRPTSRWSSRVIPWKMQLRTPRQPVRLWRMPSKRLWKPKRWPRKLQKLLRLQKTASSPSASKFAKSLSSREALLD